MNKVNEGRANYGSFSGWSCMPGDNSNIIRGHIPWCHGQGTRTFCYDIKEEEEALLSPALETVQDEMSNYYLRVQGLLKSGMTGDDVENILSRPQKIVEDDSSNGCGNNYNNIGPGGIQCKYFNGNCMNDTKCIVNTTPSAYHNPSPLPPNPNAKVRPLKPV